MKHQLPIKLKEIRRLKGMSQEEMAKKLGVKKSTYGTWERRDSMMSLEQAYDCAVILDCTIDEIAGRKPPQYKYADPDQAALNGYYESMNSKGRSLIVEAAKHMSADPVVRIEKDGVKYFDDQTAMGA